MRVIAAISAGSAARMAISLMGGGGNGRPKMKAPRPVAGALRKGRSGSSTPVAEQAPQHEEQVDEVGIEPERAHDRLAAGDGAVVVHAVHLLDLLRVPGGEPGEHQDADH